MGQGLVVVSPTVLECIRGHSLRVKDNIISFMEASYVCFVLLSSVAETGCRITHCYWHNAIKDDICCVLLYLHIIYRDCGHRIKHYLYNTINDAICCVFGE